MLPGQDGSSSASYLVYSAFGSSEVCSVVFLHTVCTSCAAMLPGGHGCYPAGKAVGSNGVNKLRPLGGGIELHRLCIHLVLDQFSILV